MDQHGTPFLSMLYPYSLRTAGMTACTFRSVRRIHIGMGKGFNNPFGDLPCFTRGFVSGLLDPLSWTIDESANFVDPSRSGTPVVLIFVHSGLISGCCLCIERLTRVRTIHVDTSSDAMWSEHNHTNTI